jgi:hypothetical protein
MSDLTAEPRSQVVYRHTREALRKTSMTPNVLADAIAEQYQARVAPVERTLQFHVGTTADSITKAQKANLQIFSRFYDGTVRLPVDLEEAWVAALPGQHRIDCERELAQRYGFLGARAPLSAEAGQMLSVAGVSIEFGQLLEHLAPVVDGQVHSVQDVAELERAIKEGRDLLAVVATLVATLEQRRAQPDCNVVALGRSRAR